ncbi:MAG: hypothetical protein ABFD69_11580 [Candidatus Sumerlaeia bacterium]
MYQVGYIFGMILALVAIVAAVLLSAAFLLFGARMCEIESRSYSGAVYSTILGSLGSIVPTALVLLFDAGDLAGFILALHMEAFAVMLIFKTTFGKAYGAAVLGWMGFNATILVIAMAILLIADPTGALTAEILSARQ